MRGLDAELQLDAPGALHRALDQRSVGRKQVADHPECGQLHRDHEEHRAEHDRLDVTLAVPGDEQDGESAPDDHRHEPDDGRRRQKHPERLVLRIDPEDHGGVRAHVGPHRAEETRLA